METKSSFKEISAKEANELTSKGYDTLHMTPDIPTRGDQYRAVYLLGKNGEYEKYGLFVDAMDHDTYGPMCELKTW